MMCKKWFEVKLENVICYGCVVVLKLAQSRLILAIKVSSKTALAFRAFLYDVT